MLKILSELGPDNTARGKRGQEAANRWGGGKKKGFQDRNLCILTFTCKSRESPLCQNHYLKFEIIVLSRYCALEKWAG